MVIDEVIRGWEKSGARGECWLVYEWGIDCKCIQDQTVQKRISVLTFNLFGQLLLLVVVVRTIGILL